MSSIPKGADVAEDHIPWNKGRLIGPKPPLKLREIWAIRIRLQLAQRARDLALFNLAIDSKLRGCDIVKLRVRDVAHGGKSVPRATVMQQKTGQPVKFELTDQTREAMEAWIAKAQLSPGQFLFPSRLTGSPHISTRQYGRIVKSWIARIGLDPGEYAIRHPLAAAHKSDPDLQADEESPSHTVAAGAYKAREHRQIFGD